MPKILITGAQGNLGRYFCTIYSDLSPIMCGKEDLDITNEEEVISKIAEWKPDVVINCAGFTQIDEAEINLNLVQSINGYGPGYLAKACKNAGAVLIHFSSSMVFDGLNEEGYNEDDVPHPISAYGRSKLLGEMELQENIDDFYIIRSTWLFGERASSHSHLTYIDWLLESAKNNNALQVVDDQIGRPTYMLDLAQATRALLENEKPFGIYHLVNTGTCSRFDYAKEILKLKSITIPLVPVKTEQLLKRPAQRPKFEVINNTKFIELRPWTEALKDFLQK